MICHNWVYEHLVIREIGFVLHKRLIATKAQRHKEKRDLILKEHEERVFLRGEGKDASL